MKINILSAFALLAVIFSSCGKDPVTKPIPANTIPLQGGKGGEYNVVVLSKANGIGASSRMFLKYAADKMPADTAQYDERINSMKEPGFGPHVHFEGLKKGTYYLFVQGASAKVDTVFTLTDASKKDSDIFMNLE